MADETLMATKPREQSALSDYLREPFSRLRGEVDRMFDEFPPRFPASNLGIRYLASLPMPALEMKESDSEYRLSVELPGVAQEDVDISIEGDMLVLKRRVSLPKDSLIDEVKADAENGVISIVIPRSQGVAEGARKIEISTKA